VSEPLEYPPERDGHRYDEKQPKIFEWAVFSFPRSFGLLFSQRAYAPAVAISLRRFFVILFARAFPPIAAISLTVKDRFSSGLSTGHYHNAFL
jgi:hypothetical protein